MSSPANVSCVCLGSWFGKLRLWNPWSYTSIGIHTSSHVCMRCRSSFPTLADATVSSRSASNKTSASKNLGQVVGFWTVQFKFEILWPDLSEFVLAIKQHYKTWAQDPRLKESFTSMFQSTCPLLYSQRWQYVFLGFPCHFCRVRIGFGPSSRIVSFWFSLLTPLVFKFVTAVPSN